MAYIWFLTANFGANRAAADAFATAFDRASFEVPHVGSVRLDVGVDVGAAGESYDERAGWECSIVPHVGLEEGEAFNGPGSYLCGHGGPADAEEAVDIDATATVLYERLACCTGYEFALAGVEVGGWRSPRELVADLSPGGFFLTRGSLAALGGLVIARDLWIAADRPEGFVCFSGGHVWLPYTTSAA